MRIDEHLLTGIILGVVVGLFFTAQLAPYGHVLLIGAFILVMRRYLAK